MAQIAQIRPEGQHAVLYFADGASIDLGLRDSLAVRTETGVDVEMTGENSLAYKPRKTQPQKQEEVPEEYNTLVTPRGSEYSLTLADGTQVWLNAASRLRFFTSDRGRERAYGSKAKPISRWRTTPGGHSSSNRAARASGCWERASTSTPTRATVPYTPRWWRVRWP